MQMVDRDERQPACPGQGLCGRDANEQGADKTGSLRDGDEVHVVERGVGVVERPSNRRKQQLEMMARRDLRDDAAVPRVQLGLRGDDVGEEPAVLRDERRRGLVAGGLDSEDHAEARSRTGSFHMISASSRLSV